MAKQTTYKKVSTEREPFKGFWADSRVEGSIIEGKVEKLVDSAEYPFFLIRVTSETSVRVKDSDNTVMAEAGELVAVAHSSALDVLREYMKKQVRLTYRGEIEGKRGRSFHDFIVEVAD
jgi:hypothetical protein